MHDPVPSGVEGPGSLDEFAQAIGHIGSGRTEIGMGAEPIVSLDHTDLDTARPGIDDQNPHLTLISVRDLRA